MALKKLSITDEQIELIKELLSKKKKVWHIAEIIGVSRTTIWRNRVFLGINKKYKPSSDKKSKTYFNWDDFKDNSVI